MIVLIVLIALIALIALIGLIELIVLIVLYNYANRSVPGFFPYNRKEPERRKKDWLKLNKVVDIWLKGVLRYRCKQKEGT